MTAGTAAAAVPAVSCPRCGGVPEPGAGPGGLARCRSCGVLGRIEHAEEAPRVALRPAVDVSYALEALRRDLERLGERPEPSLHAHELVYVPIWRVTTHLAGRLSGERRRVERKLVRERLEDGQSVFEWKEEAGGTERVERELQKRHVAVCAACPLEEYGLPTLGADRQRCEGFAAAQPGRFAAVEAFHPALRRGATVLDPIVGRAEAEAVADALIEGYGNGLRHGLVRCERLDLVRLGRSVQLVLAPIHLLRFALPDGRRGTAAIDAATGRVISLRRPPAENRAALLRVVAAAGLAGGWLTATLARLAFAPPDWVPAVTALVWTGRLALAALACGAATLFVLRHLVSGPEEEVEPR